MLFLVFRMGEQVDDRLLQKRGVRAFVGGTTCIWRVSKCAKLHVTDFIS